MTMDDADNAYEEDNEDDEMNSVHTRSNCGSYLDHNKFNSMMAMMDGDDHNHDIMILIRMKTMTRKVSRTMTFIIKMMMMNSTMVICF